jgi:mono/diheme cytochrome c family protein
MSRAIAAATFLLWAGASAAADKPAALKAFLAKHCIECHGEAKPKGDLRLDNLPFEFTRPADLEAWKSVRERVSAGTMPPEKKPKPDHAEIQTLISWIDDGLADAEKRQQKVEGRAGLRRLNRTEYENTLRDLLGVNVEVKDLLPEDTIRHGFDNIGEALNVSPTQMQKYLEAAELALKQAVATGPRPESTTKTHTLAEGRAAANIGRHWARRDDGAVVVFNSNTFPGTQIDSFRVTHRGKYRIRLKGYAHNAKDAIPFAVYYGNFGRGSDIRIQGYHEFAPGEPTTVTLELDLNPGDSLQVLPFGMKGFNVYKKDKPDSPLTYPGPGFAFLGAEVEGPLYERWPNRGHTLLFGDLPVKPREAAKGKPAPPKNAPWEIVSTDPDADSARLLRNFCERAFRRPVAPADVEPYLGVYRANRADGADFQTAMLAAASTVLCAPDFLFLREKPGPLDDHALASRLSYFLWRSMPDDELFRIAGEKRLTQPAVLKQQTERLLNDPKAARFTADFTDAWLNLREINFTTPDRQLYPEFDDLLQASMLRETRMYFDEVLKRNLPAGAFVASDFAMVNARLAKHYGIPDVKGVGFRRVALPEDSVRGGLLAQASVLKVSANGTNTSPVVRGVYVLERFMGIAPPPPPPGVPAVEPDIRGAKTVRELLAKHRSVEACAGCHRLIDPPGFALEGFDVIGGWREKFRFPNPKGAVAMKVEGEYVQYKYGAVVDAAGEMTDGRTFNGYAEFRKLLASAPEVFAKCWAEKVATFATGKEVGPADKSEIARILAATKAGNFAVRDLIHAVVQSEIFRNK